MVLLSIAVEAVLVI